MHLNLGRLPDAVEPPDALLQQFWIERQVEQHEVMRELEVPSLAADLRTDEEPRAVRLRKPRRLAVALHQGQPFVECRHLHVQALAQGSVNRLDLAPRAADEQHLLLAQAAQQFGEPVEARVFGEIRFEELRRPRVGVGGELLRESVEHLRVTGRRFQRTQPRDALREAFDGRAGVAKHHAPGAVLIEQRVQHRQPRVRIAGDDRLQFRPEVRLGPRENSRQQLHVSRGEFLVRLKFLRQSGHIAIRFRLRDELVEIVEAIRVEQAQPREVAGHAELLGRGREEQEPRRLPAERLDHGIFGADSLRRPAEMMRFIDHQHVPPGVERLPESGFAAGEKADAREHELIVEKRIRLRVGRLDGLAAFLVEDVEPEIEAAQQFHEPLMHERFREDDEHALRAAGQEQPMQDEARLDGFAEAHLVGQQHARREAGGHFRGDVELVRNQIDPPARETADLRLAPAVLMPQRRRPQIKNLRLIELPGQQSLLRLAETDRVIQFGLTPLLSAAPVADQSIPLPDGFHDQRLAVVILDGIARLEPHPSQRGIVAGILPRLVACAENNGHRPGASAQHGAEPEFGFTFADPTLAWMK